MKWTGRTDCTARIKPTVVFDRDCVDLVLLNYNHVKHTQNSLASHALETNQYRRQNGIPISVGRSLG